MTQMRNREVINKFVDGDTGHDGYGAVRSTDTKLFSYGACIARWDGDTLVIRAGWDGYSPTTSKHMKYLYDAVTGHTDAYAYRHSGYDSQNGYEGENGERTVIPVRIATDHGPGRGTKRRWHRLTEAERAEYAGGGA